MQYSPQELKENLLRHLDNEFNVVDMRGVLEVMAVLEQCHITKESLEQTRIGKYVNDMRRKTTNRDLARRAKDLVRKWQQLYATVPSQTAVPANEQSSLPAVENNRIPGVAAANGVRLPAAKSENGLHNKATSPAENISSVRSHHAPGRSRMPPDLHGGSRPSTPVTTSLHPSASLPVFTVAHNASRPSSVQKTPVVRSVTKPSVKTEPSKKPVVEKTKTGSTTSSRPPSANGSDSLQCVYNEKTKTSADNDKPNGSFKTYRTSNNGVWTSRVDTASRSVPASPLMPTIAATETAPLRVKIKLNTSGTGSVSSPVPDSPVAVMPTSAARKLPKVHVNRTSIHSVNSPLADPPAVAFSTAVRKTPKVETTAQLIKKMHANGELQLVNSETLSRIANNQIKHEADETPQSIVPEGAKPRPHKRRRLDAASQQSMSGPPCMTDADLAQVKVERVRNFLQMTPEPSSSADNDLLGLLPHLPRYDEPDSVARRELSTPAGLPTVEAVEKDDADVIAEPYRLPELPPIDLSSIDWYSNDYTVPEFRPAPTYSDVERLHYGQWEGVNGQRDYKGEWAEWSRTYTVRSYNGEPLHILPYVDITD